MATARVGDPTPLVVAGEVEVEDEARDRQFSEEELEEIWEQRVAEGHLHGPPSEAEDSQE